MLKGLHAKGQQPLGGGKQAESKPLKEHLQIQCLIPSLLQLRAQLSLSKDPLLTGRPGHNLLQLVPRSHSLLLEVVTRPAHFRTLQDTGS